MYTLEIRHARGQSVSIYAHEHIRRLDIFLIMKGTLTCSVEWWYIGHRSLSPFGSPVRCKYFRESA